MTRWQDLTPQQQATALQRLTAKQHTAILLHDHWNLSYADTARLLGIKRLSARNRIKAARRVLDQIRQQEAA